MLCIQLHTYSVQTFLLFTLLSYCCTWTLGCEDKMTYRICNFQIVFTLAHKNGYFTFLIKSKAKLHLDVENNDDNMFNNKKQKDTVSVLCQLHSSILYKLSAVTQYFCI